MNKIEQILCRKSIDGAIQIKQLFNQWTNAEVVQFYRELTELVNKNDLLPDVSLSDGFERRELLIAFFDKIKLRPLELTQKESPEVVDFYLKAINGANVPQNDKALDT